ncbi:SNF2 domain-containing protein [Forsythia ovata]|uniref:SNF2 domain-containing protein n=1 Tax=Forsythia ovata TaxID=205694 RepID=A0ABD1QSJ3_9LAMI
MERTGQDEEQITEEQRKRAEANRLAALAKRKAILSEPNHLNPWELFKCRKISPEPTTFTSSKQPFIANPVMAIPKPELPPEKFRARLEICSPDSFSITPVPVEGYTYPGEVVCFEKLADYLSSVVPSHYTQNTGGGNACVYKLQDYESVLRSLKNSKCVECEEIPWGTLNVVQRLSHSFIAGKWMPCRPEHLPDEKVDELIAELPKSLLGALFPFQLEGVRFALRRGGRCLIADEMGLGKTLQAIAIAGCFVNEGSILIVCPAILRYPWAEELERWFPNIVPSDIHLVFCHQDNPAHLTKCPKVVVISYAMLRRLRRFILEQEWVTLIVDESHNLRCTNKSSEPDELKAVLDVAMKVKHLILLSGTPSLSRPYDIFHQVNMLWPGLLGNNKYEFAKSYCSVNFIWGCQGKNFQDFSKGIRLEELNVLLKQSVMIRRLKEQVLLQLPPMRRQMIRLVLRKSDIRCAKETLEMGNNNASSLNDDENGPIEDPDEVQDNDDKDNSSKHVPDQALGIAKLPGFLEWLSIHPIIAELDVEETMEVCPRSHKMIIFAHHHKVLDGVQEFLCEKGIQFVRIDSRIVGSDRQLAIQSFQSSREVKIALIGILAGGSGLNLTSAENVVFLELPKRPSEMQQAESRAHRHGQKKPVNIYIFCAKDTSDELRWQRLNNSVHQVSSIVNGKYDIIKEIQVDSVSYLETTGKTFEESKQFLPEITKYADAPAIKVTQPHSSRYDQDSQPCKIICDSHVVHTVPRNEESAPIAESEAASRIGSHSLEEASDVKDQWLKVKNILPETKLDDDGSVKLMESGAISCCTLRFEVSQYTGRIHLYSCSNGLDSRPRPLFQSFLPEEVESHPIVDDNEKMTCKSIKDDPRCRSAIMEFIYEWNKLRPIEKRKLFGKPLQLPLSNELCYLNESLNHNNEGLLKEGSKRRKTPLPDISHPLPSNAAWRTVKLHSRNKKEKLYLQGWSNMNEPLCKLCQTPCKKNIAKMPEFFEDLFCSLRCYEEYRLRTSYKYLREGLFQIEHGICTNCHLDCHKLVQHLRPLSLEKRQDHIKKVAPNITKRKKLLDKLVHDPAEGNAWHADHIIPVYRGGGECKLENMRTLCVACHADVTAEQCAERRKTRNKAKKQLQGIMSGIISDENPRQIDNVLERFRFQDYKQSEIQPKEVEEDDLLVEVPGSAYSGANVTKTEERNQEQVQPISSSEITCSDNEASKAIRMETRNPELEDPCIPAESIIPSIRSFEH